MEKRFIEMIASDLRKLGIAEGDTVLVHSSLRSLGPVPDKAETVIQALLQVLGSDGTLLFPALSYRDVTPEHPLFDVRNTPCCIGSLPEYFRTRPGTLRSVHPTHSMSGIGKNAEILFKDHQLDTTSCGAHSPFRKLRELGTWVLFLGCSIASNTSMHAVEELVNPPYLHGDFVDYKIILADGTESSMRVRRHNFKDHAQSYSRLAPLMTPQELHWGPVLSATCALMSIPAIWRIGYEKLQSNPLYFVWNYAVGQ